MTEKQCENCKFYDEDIDTQPCCSCVEKQNFEADNNVLTADTVLNALEDLKVIDDTPLCSQCAFNQKMERLEIWCIYAETKIKDQREHIDKLKRQIKNLKKESRQNGK